MGPRTTTSQTHCLCNHLTFFGSTFLVTPNAIDVHQTAELFATFEDNPVVVSTVGCLCIIYVLVVIWARRKDIQDQAKVRSWVPGNVGSMGCRSWRPRVCGEANCGSSGLNPWGHFRRVGPSANAFTEHPLSSNYRGDCAINHQLNTHCMQAPTRLCSRTSEGMHRRVRRLSVTELEAVLHCLPPSYPSLGITSQNKMS